MSQSENIGGRAYTNGVRLTDGSRTVKAYYNEDGFLQVEKGNVRRSQLFSKAKKIPVVRGIISIFLAIWMFLKESTSHPKKYWFVFVIILADILFLIWPAQSGTASVIFAAIYYVFPVVLLILFWNKIGEVLKYHGAEHKAVNYYENNYEGKISDYSRLHRRCGSNLVFFYIIISFASGFFYIPLNAWLL